MKAVPFLLSYLVPLSVILCSGAPGARPILPVLLVFGVIPLADAIVGENKANPSADSRAAEAPAYRLVTWFYVPLHFLVLGFGAANLQGFSIHGAMVALSVGVSSGAIGITIAHELIHRTSRLERGLGVAILAGVLYAHFRIEHVLGHHAYVGTPRDPATARRDQSVYSFWAQSVFGGIKSAWRIEARRLRRKGVPVFGPRNRFLRYLVLSAAIGAALTVAFGFAALVYYLVQAFVAFSLLEVVNYVEHYGLTRAKKEGRLERVSEIHSWNSSRRLTNWFLVNLQRHSDHHLAPQRRYQVLRHFDESPQLPSGYGALVPLALVPPLFRRVVHPYLSTSRESE